jgi:Domain of unknown function DUF1828
MTCEQAIAAYLATLKEDFACSARPNGRLCIVTPYLYPDHDNIEVFVRDKGDHVFVSDLGETLRYLDTNGMDIMSTPNLLFAAKRIAEGFGASIREGVLVKDGPPETVGQLIFDVLSAVKAVSSLVYGNRAYEPAGFDDEVAEYLESHDLPIERCVPVTGISGSRYKVSLRVAGPQKTMLVETLAPKTISGVRSKVNAVFTEWSDINGEYSDPGRKLSLLNDEATPFKEKELAILGRVSQVHRWTARDAFLSALRSGAASLV